MNRILALLSSATLLAAAAQAQCATPAAVTPATLVNWDASSFYASTYGFADEGITNPPINLVPAFGAGGFPMAGAVGTLDQMWINSNGHVYLTDSTLALTQPVGAALFGLDSLAEARGGVGGSARIFPFGVDQQDSVVLGAVWGVTCDVTPGSVKVTWTDMARFVNTTDRFSYSMTLLAGGSVMFDYSVTFPVVSPYIGVSIGNNVGSTVSPAKNLTAGPVATDTGSEGLIYSSIAFNLANAAVMISPNGLGGYFAVQTCTPASNVKFGTGCHTFVNPVVTSCFLQAFAGSPAAKTALDGNALQFSLAGSGYNATWIPGGGALYVAPVTPTLSGLGDDQTLTITPSAAAPIPGGVSTQWTFSSNGVLTAGAVGNQGTSFSPSLASAATAAGLGFYVWRDWNPAESGSGPIVYEEIGGTLYITWNDVEAYGSPSPNRGTWQFQVNLSTGTVTIVMVSFETSTSTSTVLVGCTLAGTSPTPTSVTLSAGGVVTPDASLSPMTLSAAPAPIINPMTAVTYTTANMPEFVPTSGVYLSTMFLSVNPLPGGFPLTGILTTVPGCNAWIATLDLDLGAQLTFAPTASWTFTYDNVNFAPGNAIAAQAVALFDTAFPLINGEAGGFLFSNGVLSTTQLN